MLFLSKKQILLISPSSSLTKTPVLPSNIDSDKPETSKEIAGVPRRLDSITAILHPSPIDGLTNIHDRERKFSFSLDFHFYIAYFYFS